MNPSEYRYSKWDGGEDPLAPPYDVAAAMDGISDEVLRGATPSDALKNLLRRGANDLTGLDELRRRLRERRERLRRSGRLDGILERVRELLSEALTAERRELFADPDDLARLEEAELDALPHETASAVRALSERRWRSEQAREKFTEIQDLLRREVLDSQFQGLKQALEGTTAQDMARVKDMLSDLNDLLDRHSRGEETADVLRDFMAKHGDFFPEQPSTVDELIDQLARRAAAQQRLLDGLTPEQRAELAGLMEQAFGSVDDLGAALQNLHSQLRMARPDLAWGGDPRMSGQGMYLLGDATSAIAELSDVEELDRALGQSYAGASLDDVDEEMVSRVLGRAAVDDLDALKRIERELSRQGWLTRRNGTLELSPRAVRRLGSTALRRVFAKLDRGGFGQHDLTSAGAAGEPTGSSRPWEFGDTQALDVARTVRNAVLRTGPSTTGVRLAVEDFEVVETERRSRTAVALLVDLSYSMALNDTWGAAKSTALALHTLISTRYPQDAMTIIGFSQYARTLRPAELAGLEFDPVQGTNLQHALLLARRHLARHHDAEPIVLLVTDGEPTAHLEPDGTAVFEWPPMPETIALTMAEVDRATKSGITLNVFMLGDDDRLREFMDGVARRNHGRLFTSDADSLGEYVIRDYLSWRASATRAGGGRI